VVFIDGVQKTREAHRRLRQKNFPPLPATFLCVLREIHRSSDFNRSTPPYSDRRMLEV
jgi:hypothetical protein